ncbi:MAG TPA: hypothetical protein VFL65_00900 [Jatrophihabitans sp.]|nr:hypothetical protein [Jatrophihabitans sp.]
MADHNAKQSQPVLTRAGIVTALSVLAALLVRLNLPDAASWLDAYADTVAGVLLAAAPIVTAVLARRHVTPTASPRNAGGDVLVPAGAPVLASALVAADANDGVDAAALDANGEAVTAAV